MRYNSNPMYLPGSNSTAYLIHHTISHYSHYSPDATFKLRRHYLGENIGHTTFRTLTFPFSSKDLKQRISKRQKINIDSNTFSITFKRRYKEETAEDHKQRF